MAAPILMHQLDRRVPDEQHDMMKLLRMVALCKASFVHSLAAIPRAQRNTSLAPYVLAGEPPKWPVISFSVQLCADAPDTRRAEKLTTLLKKFFTWEVKSRLTSSAAFHQMLELTNHG